MSEHNPDIVYVGGGKGGLGKTICVDMVIDYYMRREKTPHLVDSDNSNLDAWKKYEKTIPSHRVNLDVKDGWMELIDLADEHPQHPLVINTGSRSNEGVDKFGPMLNNALGDLRRKLVVLWVLNRDTDSFSLLQGFADKMTKAELHVVKNMHWGAPEKFVRWEMSKTKENLQSRLGKTLVIPDVADRLTDRMKNKVDGHDRMSFDIAAKGLPLSLRIEVDRVRQEVDESFSDVL